MNKTIQRVTAAALAGVMATCMTVTASASADTRNCPCGKTTATLHVYTKSATATTSISDGTRGVSVSIYGEYWDNDGNLKTTGNGNSWTAGVTTSISHTGSKWNIVKSTHSSCCGDPIEIYGR